MSLLMISCKGERGGSLGFYLTFYRNLLLLLIWRFVSPFIPLLVAFLENFVHSCVSHPSALDIFGSPHGLYVYMMSLVWLHHMQAVHSGADLESAISNCMGYKSEVTRQIRFLVPREPSCSYIFERFSCY